jgi:hypothetical protein
MATRWIITRPAFRCLSCRCDHIGGFLGNHDHAALMLPQTRSGMTEASDHPQALTRRTRSSDRNRGCVGSHPAGACDDAR